MVWARGNDMRIEHSNTRDATGPWSTGQFWADDGPSLLTQWDTPDALGWITTVEFPAATKTTTAHATGPWSTGDLWVDDGPSLLTEWDTPEALGWNTYIPSWEDNSWWDTRNFEEDWCRNDLSAVWYGPVGSNCTAIIKFDKPAPATTDGSAHLQKMSGRLLAKYGGVMFYPSGARRRTELTVYEPSTSATKCDDEAEQQELLNAAKSFLSYAKTAAPRILFRGFNSKSGGGVDLRLNGLDGVIPHAFLGSEKPTNMWDITDLRDMVNGHLDGKPKLTSAFSSWTHLWKTATHFSKYSYKKGSKIAVLDTTSREDDIWHSHDLYWPGIANQSWGEEYLVYGPITGPRYHCISPNELRRTTRIEDLTDGSTFAFDENPGSCAIEKGAVESARKVAAFLQPRDASTENLAILTARFVSYRAHSITGIWQKFMYPIDMATYAHYTRDDIQALSMRADGWDISLVDDTMETSHCRCLRFEVQLLQAVENMVHAVASSVKVARSRVLVQGNGDRLEDMSDDQNEHE